MWDFGVRIADFMAGWSLVTHHFFSSMACAAIRQATAEVDVISRDQLFALVWIGLWLPGRIVNLVLRTNVFLGRAMTIETPFHVEGLGFSRKRHLIDTTVAGRTTDAFCDVNAVIEIDVIRQIMDAVPLQRAVSGQAFTNGRQHRRVFPDLGMTGHAGIGAGQTGERRFFDSGVAISAIDAVVSDVVFMAERDRLIKRDVDVGCVRRPIDFGSRPSGAASQNYRANDDDSSVNVRFWRKQLGH
jgi:hypothetical protein